MTDRLTVYQKPTCSKCRATLQILAECGAEFDAVDYYQTPLSTDQLRDLLRKLGLSARDVLRRDEPIAHELGLDREGVPEDELIRQMVAHPDLIQRPIVVRGERALLCRPPENVEKLL